VRCALTPARPSTVAPCLDGFAIDFPGVPARRTAWWDIVDVPGLAGIGVESEPAGVGHTRVHVRLGWRVNARVDSTSRPDSLCFVLVLPESHARAQEPAGHGS